MSHIIHTPTHTESHHNGSQPMSSASSTDTAAPTAEEFDLYKYMLHSIATAIYTQIQREDNNVADNRSVYERFKLPTFTLNGTVGYECPRPHNQVIDCEYGDACKSIHKTYIRKHRASHMKRWHSSAPSARVQCLDETCDKDYTVRSAMMRHMKKEHASHPSLVKPPCSVPNCNNRVYHATFIL